MMDQFRVFPFEAADVRVLELDGEARWVAADVYGVLGIPLAGQADDVGIAVINDSDLDSLIRASPRTEARLHLETVRRLVALERTLREQAIELDVAYVTLSAVSPYKTIMEWSEENGIYLSEAEAAEGDEFLEEYCHREEFPMRVTEDSGVNAYPLEALNESLEWYQRPARARGLGPLPRLRLAAPAAQPIGLTREQ